MDVAVDVEVGDGKAVGEGVKVGRGVRVGRGVQVGSGVRVGVTVGGRSRVGVTRMSVGYNCSIAEYQSSPSVRANSLKRAPR